MKHHNSLFLGLVFLLNTLFTANALAAPLKKLEADLLIVGGTESGWAAAIQAARMGVKQIVLVDDIDWLGGQMTAEALVAIDENRSWEETKRRSKGRQPSIPRSGLFKELLDRIEAFNRQKYGHPSPGNTTVGTTCRPSEAEAIFREMIQPYVEKGQIRIISHYSPVAAELADDQKTLRRVRFHSDKPGHQETEVEATVTIDASDWGDVIQLSGADFDYGPDLKSDYGEPLAPVNREGYPLTDMNPITYCMIVEETEGEQVVPRPPDYDERRYFNTTKLTKKEHDALPWSNHPVDAFAEVARVYQSRRIVDHYNLAGVTGPDVILLCWLVQDYPLDFLPKHVNVALEANELGASRKNIVVMSRQQRQIVFDDAKQHSLGMLHHLQTTVHDRMPNKTHSFRRFQLSNEFGTPDRMPFKPYVRESLRLKSMYVMRQQDTTPLGAKSETYGRVMYHDGVTAWQFEYDYHMTGRTFLPGDESGLAWQSYFKTGRTWGPPYAGLCLFPLRSLIPEKVDGLLGAQKNLGYTSIVSSAIRLHDQCIHIGQAAGAAAAVRLQRNCRLREIPFDRTLLTELRYGLCTDNNGQVPLALWPFRDLTPEHDAYIAVNHLAVAGLLPLTAEQVQFHPDKKAAVDWQEKINKATENVKQSVPEFKLNRENISRGEFAVAWWNAIRDLPDRPYRRKSPTDADGDGIADIDDALPLDPLNESMPTSPVRPDEDGIPDKIASKQKHVKRFNFTGKGSAELGGFTNDYGLKFSKDRGYGWQEDTSQHHRRRGVYADEPRDTFLFTRSAAHWECQLPNGKWQVTICVGDAAHEQPGQLITVEGNEAVKNRTTSAGRFLEKSVVVEVSDGRLTIDLGPQKPGKNTCLNWVMITKDH